MNSKQSSHEKWVAQFNLTEPETGRRYKVNPGGNRVYLATTPFFGGGAGAILISRPRVERSSPPEQGPAPEGK